MSSSTPAPTTNSRRVPLDKRKRTETSCDKCKSRKQKCRKEPGQDACRYCMVHNIECLTTQPRKKRLYGSVEGLGTRLALLEALVKGLLPEADVSSTDALRQLATSHGIPLPESVAAQGDADHDDAADPDGDDTVSLLPDQQGQVQYIGPASSFAFHLKLRTLVGRGPLREFVLFGKNAASTSPDAGDHLQHQHQHQQHQQHHHHHHHHALSNAPASLDPTTAAAHLAPSQRPTLELLIRTFFDRIHPDIPVLHEPSFREAYDAWLADPRNADPAWLCTFTCMLLLARRVARVPFAEDQERLWWHRVQKLLPGVIFTSSVTAVQALVLAAAHLHNTNHRDACWNLTGAAIRIAHAIGLHQDSVSAGSTPLARDTRRMLWWALYGFENMQVSSYDRPSAIEVGGGKLRYPSDKTVNCLPGLMAAYCRMWALLGTVCRAPRTIKPNSSDEAYVGPLSPAASALRDLNRWKETLPQHLQPEAIDTTPPPCQRTLIMMHGLYHYTMIVLCRSALLARASTLSKTGTDSANPALIAMADACSESGRDLAQLLLKSDHLAKFDAVVNFDIWYMLASSSALVLDLVCLNKLEGTDMSESRILLSQLADLAQRHRRNPYMPGTLEKFASLVPELHSMADSLASPVRISEPKAESHEPPPQPTLPTQPLTQPPAVPHMYHQSPPAAGTYMFADDMQSRGYPDQSYVGPPIHPTVRYDRNTQLHFMDFTINNMNDWNWHDMSGLLGDGVSGVPNIPGDPHVHGSQSTGPN